jgi:RNA polymerase sigma-70 factor (ECF subfamily)
MPPSLATETTVAQAEETPRAAIDTALVRAAQSGDRAAFTRLYEELAPVVHGVLIARLHIRDADDLVQEVFLTVWRRMSEVRDPAVLVAWILAIARNAAASRQRGTRTSLPLNDQVVASAERGAEEECERVLGAIRSLPEAYRETLTLRLVEGLTGPQIAAATGMTHGSVRVNLHRGMELLRERLGADKDGARP